MQFARELAGLGNPVLRFDYRGNGDSDGEFSETSLDTALADIGHAIDVLKERTGIGSVGLLGLRLGASLAALAAERRDDVSRLVLWEPIVNGGRYAQELLMINIATQMAIYKEVRVKRAALVQAMRDGETANVDGYEMSLRMFEDLSELNLAHSSKSFKGRCLIVRIARAAAPSALAELKPMALTYGDATLDQVQEEPFWKEIPTFCQIAQNLSPRTLARLEGR